MSLLALSIFFWLVWLHKHEKCVDIKLCVCFFEFMNEFSIFLISENFYCNFLCFKYFSIFYQWSKKITIKISPRDIPIFANFPTNIASQFFFLFILAANSIIFLNIILKNFPHLTLINLRILCFFKYLFILFIFFVKDINQYPASKLSKHHHLCKKNCL